jgi:hypothetical protein
MGKLTKRAGHILATGVLVLAGAGFLMLAGAGTAHAQSASTSVCKKIGAALASVNATLKAHPASPKGMVALLTTQLTQAASTGSAAVKSDARKYIADFAAGADSNNLDLAKVTADGDALAIAACTPSGAPATGGGSAAGLQDPALFGVGGAAVLAGIVIVGLTLRSRPRAGMGHG